MKNYFQYLITTFFLIAHFFSYAQESNKAMSFKKSKFDFQEIKQGTIVKHSFEFTNKSEDLLIIHEVITTCGCTVPIFTKTPIVPNTTDYIKVTFDSKDKLGIQRKTITIKTNKGDYKVRILANVIF